MDDLDSRLVTLAGALRVEEPVARADLDRRARELRRRRRGSRTAIAALVAAATVVSATLFWNRGRPRDVRVVAPVTNSTPTVTAPASRFPSVALPSRYLFDEIAAVGGRLVVDGEVAGTDGSRCASATVDAHTLEVGRARESSCTDPTVFNQTVGTVNTYVKGSNDDFTIRVARVDPHTGRVSDGPVVMRYTHASDTNPVTAIGGGSLWIYDAATPQGPVLLQVSTSSGRVVSTVPMPQIYRPVMAANDDGLWLGPAFNGTGPATLYHVGSRSKTATVVVGAHSSVCWLVASAHDLWAGIGPYCGRQSIQHYQGTAIQFTVDDDGYNPSAVVGDAAHGLFTMQWVPPAGIGAPSVAPRRQEIIRIDPDSGAERVIARLPAVAPTLESMGLVAGQAAYLDGSLYLLEPPFRQGGYLGYSRLLRVPLG